jgi:hypothetical protein
MANEATPSRLSREAMAGVWIASLSLATGYGGKGLSRARRQRPSPLRGSRCRASPDSSACLRPQVGHGFRRPQTGPSGSDLCVEVHGTKSPVATARPPGGPKRSGGAPQAPLDGSGAMGLTRCCSLLVARRTRSAPAYTQRCSPRRKPSLRLPLPARTGRGEITASPRRHPASPRAQGAAHRLFARRLAPQRAWSEARSA